MTFLNDVLRKILDGTDPKEALEIKKNGGRKATLNSTEPNFQAAVGVEMLKADGMLWESAVVKVADEISKDF